MHRRSASGWRTATPTEPPRTMADALAHSGVAGAAPTRDASAAPARTPIAIATAARRAAAPHRRWGAVPELARAWPRGEPREIVIVLATLALAVAHLLSWLATALARGVFSLGAVAARGFGSVAERLSGGRLRHTGALVVGWLLVVAILAGGAAAATTQRAWLLARLAPGHTHGVAVPYQPPPSACALPRAVCAPPTELLDGQPSISAEKILSVLQSYGSPAATPDFAAALYDLGVKYGVNPAYALAFFAYESHCGTSGMATATNSLGNVRYSQSASPVSYTSYQGFRHYASWRDGAEDWFWVVRTYYLNQGVRDIYDVTPIYAPSSDGNDPANYAQTVYQLVLSWSA